MSTCIDAEWLKAHPEIMAVANKTKGGYPAEPGTGPKGETCGTCANLCGKRMAKVYYKCVIQKARWTGSGRTDVKVRSPACSYWRPKIVIEGQPKTTESISIWVG